MKVSAEVGVFSDVSSAVYHTRVYLRQPNTVEFISIPAKIEEGLGRIVETAYYVRDRSIMASQAQSLYLDGDLRNGEQNSKLRETYCDLALA